MTAIHFQLQKKDLIAFQQDVVTHSYTHKIKQAYYKWISSVVLFLSILLLTELTPVMIGLSLFFTLIYYLLFPFLYQKIAMTFYKRQIEKNSYSHILGSCEMSFSDDGIDRLINGETKHFSWNSFKNVREDQNRYYFYISDLQAVLLPKTPDHLTTTERKKYTAYIETCINQIKK